MARRGGFFGYDPYDYYYPTSYGYDAYPYYRPAAADPFFADVEPLVTERLRPARRRASARHEGGFFPGFGAAEPAARTTARPKPSSGSPKSSPDYFEVEVTGPDSPPSTIPKKPAPSAEEAAVRVQAAARGLLARRMVREVHAVERQAEAVAARVAADAEALRADARARIGLGEELMRLLLRLDGVRGAREYRRRVTKRVLALQDAVDALEAAPTVVVTADAPQVQDAEEKAEEDGMEPELSVEDNTALDFLSVETTDTATMEVDTASLVVVDDEAGQTETELVAEGEKASEAEGEWEMVATGDGDVFTGEEDTTSPKAQQQQEQAHAEKKTVTTDGLDAKKLMEMVATLCERSAQQCELIGALANRVDTLERAVRRVEEADRRRRSNKKTNKDGKKNTSSFYND